MNDKTLIIAACVKDAETHLPAFLENIKNIGSMFKSVRYVFVEDGSTDSTRNILEEFEDSVVLSPSTTSNNRVERIGICRNTYLEYAYMTSVDYLLMIDGDEIGSMMITKESIESNFNTDVEWDMICANQPEGYYDLYALRCDGWVDKDCWKQYNGWNLETDVLSKFQKISKDKLPLKVKSAFGGAAFLNLNRVAEIYHNDFTTCEWVGFCNQINDVYINPAFVNFDGISHHIHDCFALRRG